MATSLRAWTGSHIAPKRGKVEDVLSTGTIEEDDDKLEQAVTNIAPTSLKRLVGRQAVIKTGHKPECRLGAQQRSRFALRLSAIRLTYFG
jgi:hypothetical protein